MFMQKHAFCLNVHELLDASTKMQLVTDQIFGDFVFSALLRAGKKYFFPMDFPIALIHT